MNKEYSFIKAMVEDSDLNGVRYFLSMKKLIKNSPLNERQKERLNKLLGDISGMVE
jgi:hypothetical protein